VNDRILSIGSATALAVALTASLPRTAHAHPVTPPPVPEKIKVQEGSKAFLQGRGVGTQNYICLPSGEGFRFVLFTPQATLFQNRGKQLTTHFFSPNPVSGAVQPTWQHSRDTSVVWASLVESSTDEEFVAEGAIPWLLLAKTEVQEGTTGGNTLTATTFIHRVNTLGGLAPTTGCASAADVGKQAFVPYEADYIFYSTPDEGEDDDDRD
jgi:hypothetical protein